MNYQVKIVSGAIALMDSEPLHLAIMPGIFFFFFSLPILLLLSIIYVTFGDLPWVSALFLCFLPAVVAIVILSMIKFKDKEL